MALSMTEIDWRMSSKTQLCLLFSGYCSILGFPYFVTFKLVYVMEHYNTVYSRKWKEDLFIILSLSMSLLLPCLCFVPLSPLRSLPNYFPSVYMSLSLLMSLSRSCQSCPLVVSFLSVSPEFWIYLINIENYCSRSFPVSKSTARTQHLHLALLIEILLNRESNYLETAFISVTKRDRRFSKDCK